MTTGQAIFIESHVKKWKTSSISRNFKGKGSGSSRTESFGITIKTGSKHYGLPADAKERRM
jgi:hypothetical protein